MVNPRVRLVRPLGRGAMGSLWVGDHLTLETEVAVKFIKPDLAPEQGDALVERFKREAKAAAKIKSPHVVQTFDQGFMDDDTPYIVMELLHGETLGQRLSRGPLAVSETVELVTQVCRGLSKAHELHIVHRDIKPDNLFLVGKGDDLLVKILDFGIAKEVRLPSSTATASGTLVGTPHYMSPEQLLRAEGPSPHVDLWALAVVAYQALLGKPPFEGETLAGIIVAITQGKYPRPGGLERRFRGSIDVWFDQALALEPLARFADAKAFAEAFRAAAEHVGASGEASEPATRPVQPAAGAVADTAQFIVASDLDVSSPDVALPAARSDERVAGDEDDAAPASTQLDTLASATQTSVAAGTIQARRSSRAAPWIGAAAGLVAVGAIGWWLGAANSTTTAPTTDASSPVVATPASAPSAAHDGGALTRIDVGRPIAIEAGRTPDDGVWLAAYRVVRRPDDGGKSYLDAHAVCRATGSALCTEAQWLRACQQEPAVATLASWTASAANANAFVVRGGDGGCGTSTSAKPASRDAARAGLCCERAVGIRGSTLAHEQVMRIATVMARIEKAFSSGSPELLSALVGETVRYRNAPLPNQMFVDRSSKMFRLEPDGWILHDTCDITLLGDGAGFSADCSCVVRQGRLLGQWLRRYVYDAASEKITSIDVPRVFREASPP
jgi:serine/threonine-protein kinase